MGEQFIPRKERHKKNLYNKQKINNDGEKIRFSVYLKSFTLYFLFFSMFGLVHIYIDIDQSFQKSFNNYFSYYDLLKWIVVSIIYIGIYWGIVDTYLRYYSFSVVKRNLIPIFAFIFSVFCIFTLLGSYF